MKKVILAGGSGFLGRTLAAHFASRSIEPIVLSRRDGVRWDAKSPGPWQKHLDGAAAVINLAGRTVNCRYNARNRQEIMDSRVDSTRALGEAIRRCANPPPVWLNASTATIYKHTFGPPNSEDGEIGATTEARDQFSVDVARAWEAALDAADTPGVRKVALRAAMVLGHAPNSVFPMLRRLARLGLGGRMGSGRQYVSWIHHRDFCRAVDWILDHPELSGPINLAAPNPLTNAEMMRLFRAAAGVPAGLPAAEWMLEVGAFFLRTETELIIKSRRVIPARLSASGFQFEFPTMAQAIADLMARRESSKT